MERFPMIFIISRILFPEDFQNNYRGGLLGYFAYFQFRILIGKHLRNSDSALTFKQHFLWTEE